MHDIIQPDIVATLMREKLIVNIVYARQEGPIQCSNM